MSLFKLSKSQFIRGEQCEKSLWLYRNKIDERTPPTDKQQQIFDRGHLIGELACKYFPGGKMVIEDHTKIEQAEQETKEFVNEGIDYIYEATARTEEGVFSRIDIFRRNDDNTFDLIEVKGSENLKPYFYKDLSLQLAAFEGAGYKINKTFLMHIKKGELKKITENSIPEEVFILEDITSEVRKLVGGTKEKALHYLSLIDGVEPEIEMGEQCYKPYRCDFVDYCKNKK